MATLQQPWDMPLEANHVVNVPPEQQKSYPSGRQFLMAGLNQGIQNNGVTANWWYNVTSDNGPTAGADPSTAKFRIQGQGFQDFPKNENLYGVIGTGMEGWRYYPSDKTWRKTVADAPGTTGGTGNLPPGPTSGGAVQQPTAIQAIEFSVDDSGDGFWVAKTPQASAAMKDGNPHKGVSIINPGEWERITGGMSVKEALSLDDYKDKGWTGLDKHFLAWQGTDSQPAGEELGGAMDAAEKGDQGALRALRAVGVHPPQQGKLGKAGSFLDGLGSLLGL